MIRSEPFTNLSRSREVIELAGAAGGQPLPFIHRVLEHHPEARLVAECMMDVNQHRFLKDHVFFGRGLSVRDPDLTAMPVMPLAMTLEMMAEAAVTLFPLRKVVALADAQTRNWLTLEVSTCRVRIDARTIAPDQVRVTTYRQDAVGEAVPIAEATVELAAELPQLGPPVLPDVAAGSSPWKPEDIYRQFLYHGPAFRAIASIDRCSDSSISSTLREPDPALLFSHGEHQNLLLPVVLIDATGQVQGLLATGMWDKRDAEIDVVFPVKIARIEIGARRALGTALTSVCTIRREGSLVHSDAELVAADGNAVLRVLGRAEQVYRVPTAPHLYWANPKKRWLSNDLGPLFADVPGADRCSISACQRIGGLLLNQFWLNVMAYMVLSRSERTLFAEKRDPPAAMLAWLLARMAAKDAVRAHGSLDVGMADVSLHENGDGAWTIEWPDSPSRWLRVAHSFFTAVAVVAEEDAFDGLGLDLQEVRLAAAPQIRQSLFPEERRIVDLAADADDDPAGRWALAVNSAKRAAHQALGDAVAAAAMQTRLAAIDPATGRISLSVCRAGDLTASSPAGKYVDVYRKLYNNHVVTLCLLPRSR